MHFVFLAHKYTIHQLATEADMRYNKYYGGNSLYFVYITSK